MEGFIYLHRKLLENPIIKNSNYLSLWIVLLLKASHKETELMWDGGLVKLKPGQFITGRKQLSKETGISETTIERALDYFEKTGHQIGQQKTNKFRIITIENWNKYQTKYVKVDTKTDNRRTTDGQQTDTINNDNNEKNINNIAIVPIADNKEITEVITSFKNVNPSYKQFYSNKTQRSAVSRLLKEHGIDKLREMMIILPQTNQQQFAPVITSPLQLETKLGALIAFIQKRKGETSSIKL